MSDQHPFTDLPDRGKHPKTKRALATWIQQAETPTGIGSGRIGWMVASSIVIAALQRAVHDDGDPLFLVKGGTYLELRLGLAARATKDVDMLFRGSFDDFVNALDEAIGEPWGNIAIERSDIETIEVPGRAVKPRRFSLILRIRGRTWRRIDVEVSPNEGRAGDSIGARACTSSTPFRGRVS